MIEPRVARSSGAKKCNAILTYGQISGLAVEAWEKITASKEHVPTDVIVFPPQRPFDTAFLSATMKAYQCVVVVEDHGYRRGLAELAAAMGKVACSFCSDGHPTTVDAIVGAVR